MSMYSETKIVVAHVYHRRWRSLVFGSLRRLNLQLFCTIYPKHIQERPSFRRGGNPKAGLLYCRQTSTSNCHTVISFFEIQEHLGLRHIGIKYMLVGLASRNLSIASSQFGSCRTSKGIHHRLCSVISVPPELSSIRI